MENQPNNNRSDIFSTPEKAVEWCLHHNLISKSVDCDLCKKNMLLEHYHSYMNRYRYRCSNDLCGKSRGVFDKTLFAKPAIPINEFFVILYMWISKSFTYDINENVNVSESTTYRVKKIIYDLIKKDNTKNYKQKIGGFETCVQVDETVIIKGKLYTNPSEMKDNVKGATWLVGVIEEETNEMRIEIVANRKLPTMKKFFKKHVKNETTVKSDGHRSYPGSVEHIRGEHIVVNHEEGFKNKEGHTTNRIEGVWGLMKYDIKCRKGVKNTAIPNFLEEFKWRRKNIPSKSKKAKITRRQKKEAFKALVKLFFNK